MLRGRAREVGSKEGRKWNGKRAKEHELGSTLRFPFSFSSLLLFFCLSNYDTHFSHFFLVVFLFSHPSPQLTLQLDFTLFLPTPLKMFLSITSSKCLAFSLCLALTPTVYPLSVPVSLSLSPLLCSEPLSLYLFISVSLRLFSAPSLFLSTPILRFTLSSSLFLSPSIWCSHLPFYSPLLYLISFRLYPSLSPIHTATCHWLYKPCDHFLSINLGVLTALPELTIK